jgi:uncharacterized protein
LRYTWSESKRNRNLARHGLDFVDAALVFEGPTFTFEDDRFDYSERRYVTLGLLCGIVVSIVHLESMRQIRVISMRKATRHEQTIFYQALGN